MLPLRFRLLGRGLHPVITSADDLRKVRDLDDAYWVATAAPVGSLRGDPVFYAAIDNDGDGRIRSDELRAAVGWLFDHLVSTAGVRDGNESLELGAVRADAPDGAAILDAARKVGGGGAVALDGVRKVLADEVAKGLSSSGKVLPAAAGDDAALKGFLDHVIAVTGGVPHPAGEPAVAKENVDAFLAAAGAWLGWNAPSPEANPLGEGTAAAHAAEAAIADKLDQYFLLCDAIALDPDLAGRARVDPSGTDLLDRAQATALLAKAPLATPRADGRLEVGGPLNPAWRGAVEALFRDAVRPVLGEVTSLDRAGWNVIRDRLVAHRAWLAAKPADAAGDRGLDLLRTHHGDATFVARTDALLAASVAGAVAVDGLKLLEKLILFQSRLLRLANNLVAMPELFDPAATALFEQGRLVIDGREFDLALRVLDAGRAEKFGASSPIFTMFVMIGEKGGNWTDQVAVPVTAGERGHLVEGQWGVFFPADGGMRHAQIRKIAVSPISIKEALWAPFRRIEEAIQNAADKASSAQTSSMEAGVAAKATAATDKATSVATTAVVAGEQKVAAGAAAAPAPATAAPAAPASPAAAAPPAPGIAGQLPMLLAGAGIAFAALTSAAAYAVEAIWSGAGSLASGVTNLGVVQSLPPAALNAVQLLAAPVALVVILAGCLLVPFLIYAIPVSFATWLRLRRRDLSTLFEGAGWAINQRMYLDRAMAVRLTRRPTVSPTDLR